MERFLYTVSFQTHDLKQPLAFGVWPAKGFSPAGPSKLFFFNDTGRAKDLMSESLTSYHQPAFS